MSNPVLSLYDHSGREHGHDMALLSTRAERGLKEALKAAKAEAEGNVLSSLEEVEISLVDDDTITQVHADFMALPEPTDVITFQHGEILLSVDTAARQASAYDRTPFDEVTLYVIHGLLHLAGYEDKTPEAFEEMRAQQEAILALVM